VTGRLSPMADLADALRRYYIQLAPARIAQLEQALAVQRQLNRELTEAAATSRDFRDSRAAGYVTPLERP
jgi:hypothetical protein